MLSAKHTLQEKGSVSENGHHCQVHKHLFAKDLSVLGGFDCSSTWLAACFLARLGVMMTWGPNSPTSLIPSFFPLILSHIFGGVGVCFWGALSFGRLGLR